MAIRLDMAFGGGAETWVRVQAAYDLAQARKRADFAIKRVSGAEVLIIVCKIWFDELRSGAKRVEYSYGRTFNERVFYIGRWSPSPTGATGCRPG